jgi:hypothetical protein
MWGENSISDNIGPAARSLRLRPLRGKRLSALPAAREALSVV